MLVEMLSGTVSIDEHLAIAGKTICIYLLIHLIESVSKICSQKCEMNMHKTFQYNASYKSKRLEIAQMFINRDRDKKAKACPHVRILGSYKRMKGLY